MESDNPIESILRGTKGPGSTYVTLGSKDGAMFTGEIVMLNRIVKLHGRIISKRHTGQGTLEIPSEQVAWVFFNLSLIHI